MRVRRRPDLILNVALAALIVAGGVWGYESIRGGSSAAAASSNTVTRTVSVSTGTVTETVSATGTVSSASTANANFVTSGTVTEIDVKVGDTVTKGQVLARVDASAANEQLTTAKANLTAAKANLTRVEDANGDDAAVASAKAQVANAQATVDADQRAVAGCVLTAPMAGTVTAVNGSVGASSSGSSGGNNNGSSSSSSGFVVLADLGSLQASASFAEADATKLKVGQAATITWSALSSARATGTVTAISPTATTSNGVNTYAVTASVGTVPTGARLGQTITVQVTVASAQNVLRVPVAAVKAAGNRYTVTVRKNGQDAPTVVEVGVKGDEYYQVTSGLSQGDVLVITTTTSTGTNNNFPTGGFGGPGGAGGFTGGGNRGGNK